MTKKISFRDAQLIYLAGRAFSETKQYLEKLENPHINDSQRRAYAQIGLKLVGDNVVELIKTLRKYNLIDEEKELSGRLNSLRRQCGLDSISF